MNHYNFSTTHYEAGYLHGQQLVRKNQRLNRPAILNISPEKQTFFRRSLPLYEKYFPQIIEEIHGLADGQQMSFADLGAFLLGMYLFPPDLGCTCFALNREGRVLLGRNSDFLTAFAHAYESSRYKLKKGRAFLGNGTAPIQMEDGMNESGLAVGLTFVRPTVSKPGLNAGMLVRYLLEKTGHVEEAVTALAELPIASAQTIALADRQGHIAVVECNAEKMVVVRPDNGKDFVATANEFNAPAMQRYREMLPDSSQTLYSVRRYKGVCRALEQYRENSPDFAMAVLSGKYHFMCQYKRELGIDTVWSVVYDVTENMVYLCDGNPSRSPFIRETGVYGKMKP